MESVWGPNSVYVLHGGDFRKKMGGGGGGGGGRGRGCVSGVVINGFS